MASLHEHQAGSGESKQDLRPSPRCPPHLVLTPWFTSEASTEIWPRGCYLYHRSRDCSPQTWDFVQTTTKPLARSGRPEEGERTLWFFLNFLNQGVPLIFSNHKVSWSFPLIWGEPQGSLFSR